MSHDQNKESWRPERLCMCSGCVSRRKAALKWHNKKENKARRLEANREYKRRVRTAARQAEIEDKRRARAAAKQVSDAELERRMTMKDWRKGLQ